jgi:hypothetical protein
MGLTSYPGLLLDAAPRAGRRAPCDRKNVRDHARWQSGAYTSSRAPRWPRLLSHPSRPVQHVGTVTGYGEIVTPRPYAGDPGML